MASTSTDSPGRISAGEGERRALRGYLPQLKIAAARIVRAFEGGTLHAIAVADPEAGRVDDLQMLTGDVDALRVDAFQVKWSNESVRLSDGDLRGLIADAVDGRRMLEAAWAQRETPDGTPVGRFVVHLHTNRPLSTEPLRGEGVRGQGLTLPRFIAEVWRPAQGGALVTIDDVPEVWRTYVTGLAGQAGVRLDELLAAAPDVLIETGRRLPEDTHEVAPPFLRDLRAFVVGLLEAVTDERDLVVIDAAAFLDLVGEEYAARWRPRLQHTFPVPPDYQPMRTTEAALQRALGELEQGYLIVTGSPGTGKSTLLTRVLQGDPRVAARYYAFIPGDDTATRGEAHALLHDLLLALDRRDRVRTLAPPRDELPLLRRRLSARLQQLGEHARATGAVAVILIDGLDHVPRDPAPETPFLGELLPADQVPDGVLFVLGTRNIADLPEHLHGEAQQPGRRIRMQPMDRRATRSLAEHAGLAPGVQDRVWELSDGHPLLASMFTRLAARADDPLAALAGIPALDGDVTRYYATIWAGMRANAQLVTLLGLICRLRSPVDLGWLQESGTDLAVLEELGRLEHLFRSSPGSRWTFFHDSFREFLRARTAERMGTYDAAKERALHAELARRCAATPASRAEAWEELHHRLRAGDAAGVLARAAPELFRRQMEALRPPDEMQPDIQEAAAALVTEHDAVALVRLSLAAAECNLRRYHQQVTGDFLELLVDLGRTDTAIVHLRHIRDNVAGNDRTATAMEFVVALHERGIAAEAARVFDEYEPLDLLANRGGGRRAAAHSSPWQALYAWGAAAALVHGPGYVIDQTERLVLNADDLVHGESVTEATAIVKANILASAAEAVKAPVADTLLAAIADDEPGRQARASLLVARAREAIGSDRDAAAALLDQALALDLRSGTAIIAAELLLRLGRADDARGLAREADVVVPPSSSAREDKGAWWRLLACARLQATLDGPLDPVAAVPETGRDFDKPRVIVARHVVRFANLWARYWRGEPVPVAEMTAAVGAVFALWDRAAPAQRRDSWQALDGRQVIAESAVHLARALGGDAVEELWAWWQQRWSVPRHRPSGGLSLIRAFQRVGIGPLSLRERLDALGDAVAEDLDSEPEAWTELGLARLAAGDEAGARAALERWTAATFVIGFRKDYQLSTWIGLLAPALPTTAGLASWLTQRIAELDRRAEAGAAHDAAEELAKAVGRTRPAEVLDRARALVSEGVLDVDDVVVTVLDATADQADDAWWILVAEVLVPLGAGPIALDAAAAAAPGREVLTRRLAAVAERVAVEGRPSERRAWREALIAAAGQYGIGADELGIVDAELLLGDDTPARDEGGGTPEDDDDDATMAIDELLERREAGNREYSGLRPLVARLDELDTGQRARLLALAENDEEYCHLASRFATEAMNNGRRDEAWTWAERAVSRSAARDWNRGYSGGPALTAARLLQRLDAGRARPVIFERFAHAAAGDRFLLGAIADDLDHMIDVFAPYDEQAVAQVVLDYVAALAGVPGPVLDNDGAPATVLSPAPVGADLVAWLLGMVHLLAWSSAERAAIALLRAGGGAEHAMRAVLLGGEVPAGRVLAILGVVPGDNGGDDVRGWLAEQASGPRLDDRVAAAALLRRFGETVPEPTPQPLPGLLRLVVSRPPEVLRGGAAIGADDVDEVLDLDTGSLAHLAEAADVDAEALAEVIRTRAAAHAAALPGDRELGARQTVLGWGFVRPSAVAVMAAEQEVAADLVDAGQVAPAVALATLDQLGRGHAELLARRPERRPACVPAAAPLADRGAMAPEWLSGLKGAGDRVAAKLDGWTVIGELTELARLDRRHSREERDQAFVPANAAEELFTGTRSGLRDLDRLPGPVPGASIIIRTARSGLCFGDGFIALHPAAARAAGLEPDEEPLAWRLNGEPAVASRWWRSGFSMWLPWSDHDEVGDGWLVVASPPAVEALLSAFPGAEVRWEVRRRVRGDSGDGELPARAARGTRPLGG